MALYHSMIVNAHELGRAAEFLAELFKPFDFNNVKLKKPDRTFSGELVLKVGSKTVRLIELGPAHTRGDTVALLPADRVLFTGNLLFDEGTPIAWAGPVSNWVRACDRILAMDVDVIVPWHGPIADKQAVREMKAIWSLWSTRHATLRQGYDRSRCSFRHSAWALRGLWRG
jgi:cyclase